MATAITALVSDNIAELIEKQQSFIIRHDLDIKLRFKPHVKKTTRRT